MKVIISGSSGLVGSQLAPVLGRAGDEVLRLVRRPARDQTELEWRPEEGPLQPARLEGLDGVVHLAGENIAAGRWTEARMQRIRESRVVGTRKLAESLAALEHRPGSASAHYGLAFVQLNRGEIASAVEHLDRFLDADKPGGTEVEQRVDHARATLAQLRGGDAEGEA